MKTILTHVVSEPIEKGCTLSVIEHDGIYSLEMSIASTRSLAMSETVVQPPAQKVVNYWPKSGLLSAMVASDLAEAKEAASDQTKPKRRMTDAQKVLRSRIMNIMETHKGSRRASFIAEALFGINPNLHQLQSIGYALGIAAADGLLVRDGRAKYKLAK